MSQADEAELASFPFSPAINADAAQRRGRTPFELSTGDHRRQQAALEARRRQSAAEAQAGVTFAPAINRVEGVESRLKVGVGGIVDALARHKTHDRASARVLGAAEYESCSHSVFIVAGPIRCKVLGEGDSRLGPGTLR